MLSPSERQEALIPILNKFDCFGWVPTIRGALSLDLAGESADLLGDVDRHSAVVHHHNGLHSEHFIAATSLTTVNDSKCGPDYVRRPRRLQRLQPDIQTSARLIHQSRDEIETL